MAQDRKVTNPLKPGTNSGDGVTTAQPAWWGARLAAAPAWRAPLAVASVWMLVHAAINSASVASDLSRRGIRFDTAEPWIWEFSSALSRLIWLWPVLSIDEVFRARVRGALARLGAYAAASVAFSVAHVATMVAMRQLVYRLASWH